MIPMQDPSMQDPNNEPWTRRDTIEYLFFALALPILAIAPFIFFGRHKAPPKHGSAVIKSRLLDILNDSCSSNISRGFKALSNGKLDSARYYNGKAAAYIEMMMVQ